MKKIVIFAVFSCMIAIILFSSFPFISIGGIAKPRNEDIEMSVEYNADALERLFRINHEVASYSAQILDSVGVKAFMKIDAEVERDYGYLFVQITDVENKSYYFTMRYGYITLILRDNENGEIMYVER